MFLNINIMIFLTRFLIFLANLYILFYVYQLDVNECECSENFKRDYIFYYSIIYIFATISLIIFQQFFIKNYQIANIIKLLLGLGLLVNIYYLYTFSNELETNKCKCSKGFGRDLMKVFSLFYIILLIITFVFVCSIYITNNNKPISKNTNLEYGNIEFVKKIN